MESNKIQRINHKLPGRFVPVGGVLSRYGRSFRCVSRPPVASMSPQDACRGCWFARTHRDERLTTNCYAVQCSSFDRKDGRNVWFIDEEDCDGR